MRMGIRLHELLVQGITKFRRVAIRDPRSVTSQYVPHIISFGNWQPLSRRKGAGKVCYKVNVCHFWLTYTSSFEFPELNWTDTTLLTELLLSRNTLYKSFNMFLSEIMECLQSQVVTYRAKAVRAIRHIATDVPQILEEVLVSYFQIIFYILTLYTRCQSEFQLSNAYTIAHHR